MSALVGTSSGLRVAVALGLSGSAWCSGAIMSFSTFSIPTLFDPIPSVFANTNTLSLGQAPSIWEHLYNRGKKTMPPIAATAALAFGYAAYYLVEDLSSSSKSAQSKLVLESVLRTRNLLALAGALTVMIVPYTLAVMKKTNAALGVKASEARERAKKGEVLGLSVGEKEEAEVSRLLKRWNMLNTGRALFPLAGCILGIVAVFF
ncbi:hypothetical protein D9757_008422 [Collybiopsis confluens]|uniref:DUF1772-domain-containing protein n=1 Tax=Collybiopsis confluens TaxID=2823264 RepID=A0A8H5G318_9AGAR|nr:hypothetical protein D9757_013327 [Collybiopsis confluens]KAF5383378.1 hypothetical protein D9757_008422 [Collybiopsis confluens]